MADQPRSSLLGSVPPEGGSLSRHGNAKTPDYKIDHATGCWNWLKLTLRGYGRVSVKGKGTWAYRAYYEAAYGPIPSNHDIHHKCKNPGCVNPDHLELLTEREHDVKHFLGEKAGITLDDIREIRRRGRVMGVRAMDVAKEFGISWQAVNNYWSGSRRWLDLLHDDPGPAVPTDPCPVCGGDVDRTPSGGPTGRRGRRIKVFCGEVCRHVHNNRKQRKTVAA